MNTNLPNKAKKVRFLLSKLPGAVVAFSGGVDSTLLLKMAYDQLGDKVIAVTAASPLHPQDETKRAKRLAKQLGCTHLVVSSCDLDHARIETNTPQRCYYCKLNMFKLIRAIAKKYGYKVLEGSNKDDLHDFRPGIKALRKLKVISPFVESGIDKSEVRYLAKAYRLPNWNMPSAACLASRIPYGTPLTKQSLKRVDLAEMFLKSLGVTQVRVRDHMPVARIEVLPDEFKNILKNRAHVIAYLKKLGYRYITLDLDGYITGSLNK
jgi:uncharacterized protein